MQRRLFVGVVCAAVVSLAMMVQASRQSDLDPGDGQRLLDKLADISGREDAPAVTNQPVILHQREINAYLRFQAAPEFPTGVTDPDVSPCEAAVLSRSGRPSISQPCETLDRADRSTRLRYLRWTSPCRRG